MKKPDLLTALSVSGVFALCVGLGMGGMSRAKNETVASFDNGIRSGEISKSGIQARDEVKVGFRGDQYLGQTYYFTQYSMDLFENGVKIYSVTLPINEENLDRFLKTMNQYGVDGSYPAAKDSITGPRLGL